MNYGCNNICNINFYFSQYTKHDVHIQCKCSVVEHFAICVMPIYICSYDTTSQYFNASHKVPVTKHDVHGTKQFLTMHMLETATKYYFLLTSQHYNVRVMRTKACILPILLIPL